MKSGNESMSSFQGEGLRSGRKWGLARSWVLWFVFVLTSSAYAQLTDHHFERLWPALPQPWNFYDVKGLTLAPNGHVYVTDRLAHRVQQFTQDGVYLGEWGGIWKCTRAC